MTHLAAFEFTAVGVAKITPDGEVIREQHRRGGAARALSRPQVAPVRIVFLPDRPIPEMSDIAGEQRDRPARLRAAQGAAPQARRARARSRLPAPGLPRRARHPADGGRDRGPSSPTPIPKKREKLIDALLERPEFAEFWAQKWSDLLRNEEKALDKKGVAVFHRWIAAQLAADRPLNEFARDILAARGSTYANPPANFYRAVRDPLQRAEAVAQVFLGVRVLRPLPQPPVRPLDAETTTTASPPSSPASTTACSRTTARTSSTSTSSSASRSSSRTATAR